MHFEDIGIEARKASLQKARFVRTQRALLKSRLKKGIISLQALMEDPETRKTVMEMRVMDIVSAVPGLGRLKAARLLEQLQIKPNKKLSGLGKRQKKTFYDHFHLN